MWHLAGDSMEHGSGDTTPNSVFQDGYFPPKSAHGDHVGVMQKLD